MWKWITGLVILVVSTGIIAASYLLEEVNGLEEVAATSQSSFQDYLVQTEVNKPTTPSPTPTPLSKPVAKTLPGGKQIFQTFNNCGPASLSMALSHYGVDASQQELGSSLRPYQNPQGDNDDKSVTLEELAKKAQEYDLVSYHRPNGDIEKLQLFIANDIPVITRTWLNLNEDIGHYRVVKGYDEAEGIIIQDDSLQGANLRYANDDFLELWQAFGYEYLVVVPQDKTAIVEAILGDEKDPKVAWERSLERIESEIAHNPDDRYARFNKSVALYHLSRHDEAIETYEAVEAQLPNRMLWYQLEPILAYYHTGDQERVLEISERILSNQNRAFSELYHLRSEIFRQRGDEQRAQEELEKVTMYNSNYFTYSAIL